MRDNTLRYILSLCTICLVCAIAFSKQSSLLAQAKLELTIFAASSLSNVFDELAEKFSDQYHVDITINYGGSSTLTAQLLQGAEADIFASANDIQMQILVEEGLIQPESVAIFAENELIIVVPHDNPANLQDAIDLTQSGIFLVFAAPNVPIRIYTNTLLEALAQHYSDTSFTESVLKNVVSEETNVRQILARVLLGEADAGIVYRSDATPDIAEQIQVIELPQSTSPRAIYPIAPLEASSQSEEAALFIEFVLSDEGQVILEKWGFCSPQDITVESTPEASENLEESSHPCESDA